VNRNAVVLGKHLLLENYRVVGVTVPMVVVVVVVVVMVMVVVVTVPMAVVLLVFSAGDDRHPRSRSVPAPTRRAHAQLTSIDRIRNSRPASTSTSALPHPHNKNMSGGEKVTPQLLHRALVAI
jgi:hypothetical protein